MTSGTSRYTEGTLIHKKFIHIVALSSFGSLALGVLLVVPSQFDTPVVYARSIAERELFQNNQSLNTSTLAEIEVKIKPQSTPTFLYKQHKGENLEDTGNAITKNETQFPETASFPFYSQFTNITSATWQKVGCGITSLAMLIEFYEPGEIPSVDSLLQEGIDAGAYLNDAGWTYNGLIAVSKNHGLTGETHIYTQSSMDNAFEAFKKDLEEGPLMASVHYTFEPTNPIPHLVIINSIKDGFVFYNDPAAKSGGGSISIEKFKSSWKKRYIEFRPAV